jgi:hypothetical protein
MSETQESVETVETAKPLLVRRTQLSAEFPRKFSRDKVADAAGTTPSKIWRIENEGKRTTSEERQSMVDALNRLEQEARTAKAAETQAENPQ